MNESDYRVLAEFVERQLRTTAASDIADSRHFFKFDSDSGELQLASPRIRVIEMLATFERFLALQDGATYLTALNRINRSVDGPQVQSAFVSFPADDSVGIEHTRGLDTSPELGALRAELRSLIARLIDDR